MNLYTGRLEAYVKTIAVSLLLFCSFFLNKADAQRVYANQVTIGTALSDHVTNPTNATSSSETTFAQLNSYGGVAVGLGSYSGQLELKFPTTLPAGVTTYVRINSDTGLLKALLGGSLGNVLANVLGTVVLGNHYFNIEARNGTTAVLTGNSTGGFAANNLRLIQDVNGYYYLAITPAQAYDRVYIQDVTNAVLLGTSNSTQVYYAFYNNSISSDPCVQGFATSFDGSGLNLDALQLGGAGVTNPRNAIDADITNYSQLGLGALAVAGSISQDIYFENLSKANDEFHVKLQSSPALLNVGLANNITVTTFNGATQVSSQPLNTLLSVDLLGLLNNGQATTFVVRPGQEVNRIRITFSSLLNANLTQSIRLYGAIRTAGRPTFTGTQSQNYTICTGGTVSLNATTTTGNELRWYADSVSTTPLFTTSSGAAFTPTGLSATTTYYVAAAKIGCTYESERAPVTVTVKTIPVNPVVPAVQPICTGKTATFAVNNPEAGVTYRWYTAATGGALLDSGVSFVTPVLTDSTTFYVEGSNGTCTNAGGRTAVLVPVSKLPLTATPTPLVREICSGRTTSFTIQNPEAGISYNWYDAPTGGNLVFTGTNFVTPQLAANTSYYVEGVNATGCVSSTRTQVSVVVNPSPATPQLVTAIVNINPGGTATFAVASPIDSLTYNWYDAATGGTLVGTGTSFTSGILTASTNYYVEAVSSKGCTSLARATATVNVITDVVCGFATSQQTVSQSVCLLCGVTNGDNSIDNDLNNYATISTTVGVGGFGQLLKFGNTGYAGDSISVVLEVPGQLIGANLLGGIALQTYSGNNPNGDLIFLDSAVASLQLLGTGGTNKFKITVPAKNSFDGVAVTLAGVSAIGQLRVYSAQTFAATPRLAPQSVLVHASSQTSPLNSGLLCVGCGVTNPLLAVDADTTTHSTITATLGVAATVGQLLQFPANYNAGDSIQVDLEVPSQVLGAQVLGSIQVQTYSNGVANGSPIMASSGLVRAQLLGLGGNRFRLTFAADQAFNGIAVTVAGTANVISNLYVYDAAIYYSSQNIVNVCTGSSAVLTVAVPVNATINWYTTASGGTPVFTGTTYTTPPVTTATTYYIEASRYGCVNANRTAVNVIPNAIPDNPTLNANSVSICSGDSAKLYATAPVGRLFKWYTTSSGGTAIYTGDTLVTPALTATTTYYAEAVNNGCASNGRTPVVVTVNTAPADVAVTPPSATIGSGQTASFVASSSTPGATFNWYAAATGGAAIFTGPSFVTPALTASTTYYLGATGTTSCSLTTRLAVPVTVVTGSGIPVPCDAATTQTTAVNGICIGCSVDSAALAVDADATTASELHVIAGLAGASVQQTFIFPFTADAGDTVAIPVTFPVGVADVSVVSSLQAASYNGATFNNDRATVSGTGPVQLQLLTGGTTGVIKFVPAQSFDRVELRLNSGLATLLSAVHVQYAQRIKPTPTTSADTVAICAGQQATLVATAPSNATFKWYNTPTGGTALFVGATYQTPVLTDSTIYYAESVSNTGCAASIRKPVVVNVIPAQAAPAVTDTLVTICSGTTATLSVQNAQTGITYNWYTSASGGTAIFSGTSYTTPALTRDSVFYVGAVTSGGCVSAARTAVRVAVNTALLPPAVTDTTVTTCANSVAILNVQNPQSSFTYNWYNVASGGTVLATGASFTTPAITANATYYVEAASGTCVSTRTAVNVTVAQPPAAPAVTVNPVSATITSGGTAVLTATSTTAGATFNWYLQATGGTAVFSGASYTTPALTATTTYYVEAVLSGSGCASTRTPVTITVNPGVNLACDAVTSETNTANGVCIGCGVSTGGGAVDTDTTTYSTLNMTVAALGASVEQLLRFPSVSAPGDTVTIALEGPASLLTADILGAIQVTSYNGATSNNDTKELNNGLIKVQLLGLGASGKFLVRFAPAAAFDGVQVRLNGGLVSALSTLNVYYATRVVAPPVVAAAAVSICSGSTATLTATASPNAIIEWFTTASGGTAVGRGGTFTTPQLTATTIYFAQAKRNSADSCANVNRTQVTVLVNARPATPVTADTVRVCAGTAAVLSVTGAQSGITYNWYNASGVLSGTGSTFTTPALSTSTFYAVEALNTTTSCAASSRDTARIIVSAIPSPRGIVTPNDSVTTCVGSVTLQVENPEAGVVYNWYNVAAGGSIVFTGTSFQTPVLTATTVYYIEAVSAAGCSAGTRTPVTVVVNPPVTPPSVVSNNVNVCSGSAATLQIQSPLATVVYRWYSTPAGGTELFEGTTYVTGPLTANATYYADAISVQGCAASSRTAVTVTVNALPATPVLVNSNVPVCSGSAATLQVQNAQSGITYRWYDAATAGNLVATGPSFTTPALTTGATYYVEASNSAGCNSAARAAAVVNVNPAPAVPVIAVAGTTVCSGSAVSLSVQTPQPNVTYNWYNGAGALVFTGITYGIPSLTATTTYSVEAVSGAGCNATARASVTITVNNTPAAPVIAGATGPVCSGSSAVLTVQNPQAGTTYNWYDAATGGNLLFSGTSVTTPALTANVTYYVEAATGTCVSATRTQTTVTVSTRPANPVIASAGTTICSGTTATLTVTNVQTGLTYNWYTAQSGGTLLTTGSSYTTPVLTSSATYYVEVTNGTCTGSARTAVDVTVLPVPAAPVVAGVTICSGDQATLQITSPQTGFTYRWYALATGGSVLTTGTSYTTAALSANATYYVEAVNAASCSSGTRTAVAVTVNTRPAVPVLANANVSACSGNTATLAVQNPQTGIIYNWYDAATGGSLVLTGASVTTSALTSNVTYYVEAAGATCTSATRAQVTVTVNARPANPTIAATGTTICSGSTTTLSVSNAQTGFTYSWYTAQSGGTLLTTGSSYTTDALTANATYYVEVSNGTCTSSTRTVVEVTVQAVPAAPIVAGSTICSGTRATLQVQGAQTGFTYRWYDAAAGGNLLTTATSYTTDTLTANVTYYVEAVNTTSCASAARTAVTVTVNARPAVPVLVNGNVSACSGNTATLAVQNAQTGITYNWYDAATGGNLVLSGASVTTPALTSNVTYYVEAAGATCTSATRAQVTVTVNARPANPTIAATGTTICSGNATTLSVSNAQTGFTYSWYSAQSGGTLLTTGSSYTTGTLTANATYYVEASNGTCTSSARTAVDVTVQGVPAAPIITGTNICSGSQAVLQVQSPQTGYTYRWYDMATGGNLLTTGTSYTTTALTANTTYYVEAINAGGCSGTTRTAVAVTVNAQPATPVLVNANATTCSGGTAMFEVQSPQTGITYIWYDAATGGSPVFTGSTFTTQPLTANTNYYVAASSTGGGCVSTGRAVATATVSAVLPPPVVSADGTTACIGQATTLSVQNAQASLTYRWYTAASGGTLLSTGSSYTTPALTTNATYFVGVSNATCTSATRTQVNVTVVPTPSAPVVAASGRTICAGGQATLDIQNPDAAYVYRWYDLPSGGNLLFSGNTYITNPLSSNTSFYVEAAVNAGCVSTSRTTAAVTVNAAPAAPTVVANSVSVCTGGAATLSVQSPVSGYTYNWYTTAAGGTVLFTGANYALTNITANAVYYVEAINASGCASVSRSTVNVSVTTAPAAPVITNSSPSVCSGSMVTLTASSPVTGAVYNWYASATGTSIIYTGNPFATGAITSDTTFYVSVANAGGCASSSRGQATVTLLRPLDAPVVSVDSTTATSVTFKWNAVTGATGYEVTLDGGISFATPNGANGLSHTISGMQPNQTVTIQVRALGAQSCQTSPLSAKVTGTATNPLGNSVFIPNVFTPNADGKNDRFTALSNNIASLEMWIFSQWGDMLYRSTDRDGWDGMSGGKLQPVGVYVYIFKIKLLDGTVVDRKGSVNLVR